MINFSLDLLEWVLSGRALTVELVYLEYDVLVEQFKIIELIMFWLMLDEKMVFLCEFNAISWGIDGANIFDVAVPQLIAVIYFVIVFECEFCLFFELVA